MANEKILNTRLQQKHDAEENWRHSVYDKNTGNLKDNPFIPKDGEIIVYDKDNNNAVQRVKIGDGVTNVCDLPFVAAPVEIADSASDGNIEFIYPGNGVVASRSVGASVTYALVKNGNTI